MPRWAWIALLLLIMVGIAAIIINTFVLIQLMDKVGRNEIQTCMLYVHIRDSEIEGHLALIPLPASCS